MPSIELPGNLWSHSKVREEIVICTETIELVLIVLTNLGVSIARYLPKARSPKEQSYDLLGTHEAVLLTICY